MFPFTEEARKKLGTNTLDPNKTVEEEKIFPYEIYDHWSRWENMSYETRTEIVTIEGMLGDLTHEIQTYRKELGLSLVDQPFLYLRFKKGKCKKIFRFAIKEWDYYIKYKCNISLIFLASVPFNGKTVEIFAGTKSTIEVEIYLSSTIIGEYETNQKQIKHVTHSLGTTHR